jgi:hypothetical protein
MKIVDRATFLALPPNTLYSKYAPCYMEPPSIKMDSITNDWFESEIHDAIDCQSSSDFADKLQEAQETGCSLKMDFETQGRDGCYEQDQLFAVWEPDDVKSLIARLQECIHE